MTARRRVHQCRHALHVLLRIRRHLVLFDEALHGLHIATGSCSVQCRDTRIARCHGEVWHALSSFEWPDCCPGNGTRLRRGTCRRGRRRKCNNHTVKSTSSSAAVEWGGGAVKFDIVGRTESHDDFIAALNHVLGLPKSFSSGDVHAHMASATNEAIQPHQRDARVGGRTKLPRRLPLPAVLLSLWDAVLGVGAAHGGAWVRVLKRNFQQKPMQKTGDERIAALALPFIVMKPCMCRQ